jgi:hypothetical protein
MFSYIRFVRWVGRANVQLEAMVQADGGELLRRLIQGHLDQRRVEEPLFERVVGEDGIGRTQRREGCKRRMETRFGGVIVSRRGYGGRGLGSVFPLNAELNLSPASTRTDCVSWSWSGSCANRSMRRRIIWHAREAGRWPSAKPRR